MPARSLVVVTVALALVAACKSNAEPSPTGNAPAPPPTTAIPSQAASPVSSAIARVQVQISMRTSDHLAVVRDVFGGKAEASTLRPFFDPGPAGDAASTALFDNVSKLAKDGWKLQRFEVRTIRVDPAGNTANADVFEWLVRNDQSQCRTYIVPWTIRDNAAFRGAAFDVREAKCPAK
jgi:hypothetical protein